MQQSHIKVSNFDGSPDAYYSCARPEDMVNRIDKIVKASEKELALTTCDLEECGESPQRIDLFFF